MKLNPIHSTIAALVMLLVLPPVTAAPQKDSVPTFDPAGTDPIKSLWVLPQKELLDPVAAAGEFYFSEPTSTKSGDLVFVENGKDNKNPGQGATLVDRKTGKVVWRIFLTDIPPGSTEWNRGCIEGPDGHIVVCSVVFGGGDEIIHLRRLDRKNGKVLTQVRMAINDPTSSDGTKGKDLYKGGSNYLIGVRDQHVIVANCYFAAEVDMAKGKVIRSSKVPEKMGKLYYQSAFGNGAYAFWWKDPQENPIWAVATLGEEPINVPPVKSDWRVVAASPQGGKKGYINVLCESPDKQDWTAGAYDPLKKKWVWVKTDTELATPIPGSIKKLTSLSFDGRTHRGEKYEGQWFVDADTGELRHKTGVYDGHLLADGRRWTLTSTSEAKKGQPVEARLVNIGNGNIEAQISRDKPFPPTHELLFRPDGDVLIAEVNAGNLELEVISASRKALFPPRKVALDLPSPPTSALLETYGFDDLPGALLRIGCKDGSTYYCVLPLPAK